jgi:hypothetical protein
MNLLPFEDQDPSLIPMSARRALDLAGVKLSLLGWQRLSFMVRETLAATGEDDVDPERVRALLEGVETIEIDPIPDPPADRVPPEVRAALGDERPLTDGAWRALSTIERYAIASYVRRDREERLARAYDALIR